MSSRLNFDNESVSSLELWPTLPQVHSSQSSNMCVILHRCLEGVCPTFLLLDLFQAYLGRLGLFY